MKKLAPLSFLPSRSLPKRLLKAAPPSKANNLRPAAFILVLVCALVCAPAGYAAKPVNDQATATLKEIDTSLGAPRQEKEEEEILSPSEKTATRLRAEKVASWLRQAEVAMRIRDFKTAEAFYLQVLAYEVPDDVRRETMLSMAKLFDASGETAKQAAVLEKFIEAFPEDPGVPQVYIKVGILYRELGLTSLAMMRFYSVLNFSLKIDLNRIEAYRELCIRAQMEIADTHFVENRYSEAIKFYSRLRLLELSPEDRARAIFQTAECHYLMKSYPDAIANFESFIASYPKDAKTPEAMFNLADSYSKVGRYPDASRIVLDLLKRESKNAEGDEKQWIYWQKKAGMQMASNFFSQNDFANALTLYQAMLPLGTEPGWTWSILYQIGMCYEKLSMPEKAKDAYQKILDWLERDRNTALKDETLKSTYDMAKWRIDNLQWRSDTSDKLEKLLDKSRN